LLLIAYTIPDQHQLKYYRDLLLNDSSIAISWWLLILLLESYHVCYQIGMKSILSKNASKLSLSQIKLSIFNLQFFFVFESLAILHQSNQFSPSLLFIFDRSWRRYQSKVTYLAYKIAKEILWSLPKDIGESVDSVSCFLESLLNRWIFFNEGFKENNIVFELLE